MSKTIIIPLNEDQAEMVEEIIMGLEPGSMFVGQIYGDGIRAGVIPYEKAKKLVEALGGDPTAISNSAAEAMARHEAKKGRLK